MRIVHSLADHDPSHGFVFVPTMGALHRGHAALIRQGSKLAQERGFHGGCLVSVFVNPTQFDEKTDYTRYPRTLERDAQMCRDCGATVVWAPDAEEIYPAGTPKEYDGFLPPQAQHKGLEDTARPGHLEGVVQVVTRLFELVQPRAAIFGEKDWQQLQMITQLAHQLRETNGWEIDIVPGPTVREGDGLAMSSRNVFLGQVDRVRAAGLRRALLKAGTTHDPIEAEALLRDEIASAGIDIDYVAIRDAHTLEPITSHDPSRAGRALAAGRLGNTRILDNCPWPLA
ncbi:MAG: pantoate--beta-alanine ligase [Phycisphaeraceae bacterium]|nr:pantoate--beta-alanine ligase [Phycisphaerales bacterium]MCB9860804.1 pantoate--beta-alanine ligase [Phycisphaeraceae bacterium]